MDRLLVAAVVLGLVAVLAARWRARANAPLDRIDPDHFGLGARSGGQAVAGFTSPMCHACQLWRAELEARGLEPAFVDVKERPDLAREYGVRTTPAVFLVDLPRGSVLRRFGGDPRPAQLDDLQSALLAA